MRVAIYSDIHANPEAFAAVLEDARALRVDASVCVGDCVSYGPDSEGAATMVRERGIPCVRGNHELALVERRHLNWFNPVSRTAVDIADAELSAATREWMRGLPMSLTLHGAHFVHGFPPASAKLYLHQASETLIESRMFALPVPVCCIGHTHELRLLRVRRGSVEWDELPEGETRLGGADRYLVNVGSVGQPRDGDPRAKYVIWEPERMAMTVRFVGYDHAAVAARIRARGIPEQFARRLEG
ncbi:MAG: metallophosphoesterase family protein [Desulfovibrionaceae bacterium]|jgi:predicted phosphodiesterase|nr:metallophosphoesterase family protein [Desulfovibrionaceae bacterium]